MWRDAFLRVLQNKIISFGMKETDVVIGGDKRFYGTTSLINSNTADFRHVDSIAWSTSPRKMRCENVFVIV